jgi:hypothetical protein
MNSYTIFIPIIYFCQYLFIIFTEIPGLLFRIMSHKHNYFRLYIKYNRAAHFDKMYETTIRFIPMCRSKIQSPLGYLCSIIKSLLHPLPPLLPGQTIFLWFKQDLLSEVYCLYYISLIYQITIDRYKFFIFFKSMNRPIPEPDA